jgi:hypothetical protein
MTTTTTTTTKSDEDAWERPIGMQYIKNYYNDNNENNTKIIAWICAAFVWLCFRLQYF